MSPLARILLVEDDPADTRLVLDALADLELHWQTLALPDGSEALDWLRAGGTGTE